VTLNKINKNNNPSIAKKTKEKKKIKKKIE
jgi:hypothetical protein